MQAQPNRAQRLLIAFALCATLAACETIPVEQCPYVDWQALGIEDGLRGHGPDRIAAHRSACVKVGVAPDMRAWEAGRQQGLMTYCQLPNAITLGLSRQTYTYACAAPTFGELHAAARRLADARHAIEALDRDLDARERRLVTDRKLSDKDRAELGSEIRQLERRRDRLRDERRDADRALERSRERFGV